ncbi:C4-dicarboxylate ABC transporter substrate-binding protein [Microvirga aerilata]|uniref:C4-dicarboxylate ABC transporter substrate-binding protein n=1 Tax=Microvirga aerilata TaxID=670292 RepID=A0A936ZCM9_9HYPH|nr:TAXI family TRAP transporter solute-binding subunit [Microvirga aerilata]MBL0408411.1 C4-dicarboxylate ABC transporter substrate-binding protein [Microvirga aerilata]
MMVPDSVARSSRIGVAAALLLLVELIPSLVMAQTPPTPPIIKQAAPARDPNTIGIVGGGPEEGALRFVNEIAKVIASGQETGPNGELALRALPFVGRGGVHDVRDVLSLPGVDMAITQEHILTRLQESKELGDLKSRLVYVTKLFNEEFHVIARQDVRQVSDLAGKPVNLGDYGNSAEDIARYVFRTLGVKVSEVYLGQDEALEEMRQGRVAATAFLAAKPAAMVERLINDGGFHLIPIPVPADATLYLPTSLRHEDYPKLIPTGEGVETVAVGTVLIAYNWPEKSSRYQLLGSFVDAFLSRFSEFQAPSRHPKWQEVNLAATLPGWKRFKPAERWLQSSQARRPGTAATGSVSQSDTPQKTAPEGRDAEAERLFEEFLHWREQRGRR